MKRSEGVRRKGFAGLGNMSCFLSAGAGLAGAGLWAKLNVRTPSTAYIIDMKVRLRSRCWKSGLRKGGTQ